MTNKNIGIAWYSKDQWDKLRATAFDKESIEDTFEEWQAKAEETIENMRRQGIHVIKVSFDVDEYNIWCLDQRKIPNGESRSEYVVNLLRDKNK